MSSTDPHIHMRHIRVCFAHSRYDYETSINGTRADIVRYFSRGPLNVGIGDADDLQTPIRVEFISGDGSGDTIAVHLDTTTSGDTCHLCGLQFPYRCGSTPRNTQFLATELLTLHHGRFVHSDCL